MTEEKEFTAQEVEKLVKEAEQRAYNRRLDILPENTRILSREDIETINRLTKDEILKHYQGDEPLEVLDDEIKPDYYHQGGLDVIGYAEMKLPVEQRRGFFRINVMKYIMRYQDKGKPLVDLRKCREYIDLLIELEEKYGGHNEQKTIDDALKK